MGSRISEEDILKRFKSLYGDLYDYSKFKYIDALSKSTITCRTHGEFQQTPAKHYNIGQGCPKCGKSKAGKTKQKSQSIVKNYVENQPTEYKLIPLRDGIFAKIDNEDYDKVVDRCWKYNKGYAISTKFGSMHRFIMNPPDDMFVDHIDRDRLSNRRSNLRICTPQENTFNAVPYGRSKYKGVSWNGAINKWVLQIVYSGETVCREYFDDEIEAAIVYDEQIIKYHGEFAYLNFPNGK